MKKNDTSLVIINTLTLVLMLFANFASNTGTFSANTVADISFKYDTLFAPAGYAFIIWGFLFLLAIGFVIYQWYLWKNGDPDKFINRTGYWFAVSNIANAAWVYCWVNELMSICVVLILILLISLVMLVKNLNLKLNNIPGRTIFFVAWPINFYLGWIMVATIACVSAWLVSLNWTGAGVQQNTWTILSIAIACLLFLVLILKRNLAESALVGIWAFIAIAVRQWHIHNDIVFSSLSAAVILCAAILINLYQNYFKHSSVKSGK